MEIGNKIRTLRTEKGVTQEQLAEALHVTGQAVSKWENGASTPDISLLPLLSVYFGVTIDELFAMTDDMHMERIRNMLCDEKFLSRHDFDYAESYLTGRMRDESRRSDCLALLSELHLHRARGHSAKATQYAKEGLSIDPTRKCFHSALCESERGGMRDWCISNHHALIRFYQEFLRKNPDYGAGWQWLADHLIDDGRLSEATQAAEKIRVLMPGFRYLLYTGRIEKTAGHPEKALETWRRMIEKYPDDWCALLSMGDCMAQLCRYDEAVSYYQKAVEKQPRPRYTDAPLSIAHIREIEGRYAEAADAMDGMLKILRDDWHISSGEGYDEPLRERDRYLSLAKKG